MGVTECQGMGLVSLYQGTYRDGCHCEYQDTGMGVTEY